MEKLPLNFATKKNLYPEINSEKVIFKNTLSKIMKIEKIKIKIIKPLKFNPRIALKPEDEEYQKIKKSVLEFGLVEPFIVNKRTGNLISGHQRLKILKELGKKEVEAVIVDLSKSKEKALNLAINKITGKWDYPKLKELLIEIDTGEFDIEATGFTEEEIDELKKRIK